MKKILRMSAIILSVVLVFVLIGCAERNDPGPGNNQPTPTPAGGASAGTGTTTTDPEPAEPDEFSIFVTIGPTDTVVDNSVVYWFEEMANVKFDFVISTGPEMITLLLHGGDYPEIFLQWFSNDDIVQYGVVSEIFVPIDEYIEGHAPNINAYFNENPRFKVNMTAPNGRIYGVRQLPATLNHGHSGMKGWINTAWLDVLGLSMPNTTEELYDVLVAFRDGDPNGNGLKDEIPLSGAIGTWNGEPWWYIMNSFILSVQGNFVMVDNGRVDFVANTDAFREGLRFNKRLVDEGLMDVNSFTQPLDDLIVLGQNPDIEILGMFAAGHIGMALDLEDIERSKMYAPLVNPIGPSGRRFVHYSSPLNASGTSFAITDRCHNVPRALEVIDLMFNELNSVIAYNGTLENGLWQHAEPGLLDFEGNPALYQTLYARREQAASVVDDRFLPFVLCDTQRTKYALVSDDIYDPASQQYELRLIQATQEYLPYRLPETLPVIWATPEAAQNQALLSVAILEYVRQSAALFITGGLSLDNDWDDYVAALSNMGLAEYVKYFQDGVDSARARGD